jgi:hypothetical protein
MKRNAVWVWSASFFCLYILGKANGSVSECFWTHRFASSIFGALLEILCRTLRGVGPYWRFFKPLIC